MTATKTVSPVRAAVTASGDYEPGSNPWFWHYIGIRDDLKAAIGKGRGGLGATALLEPWFCECEHNLAKHASDMAVRNNLERIVVYMEMLENRADQGYFAPIWKNGIEAVGNTLRAGVEFRIMFSKGFDTNSRDTMMGWVDKAATVAAYFEEVPFVESKEYDRATVDFFVNRFKPGVKRIAEAYDKLCTDGIDGALSAVNECMQTGRMDPLTDYIDSVTDLYDEMGKIAEWVDKGSLLGPYLLPKYQAEFAILKTMAETYTSLTNYLQPIVSALKGVSGLLRTEQTWDG